MAMGSPYRMGWSQELQCDVKVALVVQSGTSPEGRSRAAAASSWRGLLGFLQVGSVDFFTTTPFAIWARGGRTTTTTLAVHEA
jgi:hypothetical protein